MTRTQIQFTDSQLEALRQLSRVTSKSIAELTRDAVDRYLGQSRQRRREELVEGALKVAGGFASGRRDVSTDHDRYLAEALGE